MGISKRIHHGPVTAWQNTTMNGSPAGNAKTRALKSKRAAFRAHLGRCKLCSATGERCPVGDALQTKYRRAKRGELPRFGQGIR